MVEKIAKRRKNIISIALILFLVCTVVMPKLSFGADDEVVEKLDDEIAAKEKEISEIENKIDFYNKVIEQKQQEQLTLKSQIELLDANIEKTQSEIEVKEKEIDLLKLEIEDLKKQISDKESEISLQKGRLGKTVRELYMNETRTPLEITVANDSFSDFYNQLTYLSSIGKEVQNNLDTIKALRDSLQARQQRVEEKTQEVEKVKADLEKESNNLVGEKEHKDTLLAQTEQDEEKFQSVATDIRSQWQNIDSTIRALEKEQRDRIDELNKQNDGDTTGDDQNTGNNAEGDGSDFGGPLALSWPIPSRLVTCEFHCGGYPFARFFAHPGIDISTDQGTEVKSAASGYVAIAKDGGQTGYSYISIIHGTENGKSYSTVYGHLSQISSNVYEKLQNGKLIRKGEVIGLSGGMPGTPGAGNFSTGPHLHFELRENGIPIDPRSFLP